MLKEGVQRKLKKLKKILKFKIRFLLLKHIHH